MNKTKGIKKLMWILMLVMVLILLIIVYFGISFSPLKSDFEKEVLAQISDAKASTELFIAEEIENLPVPVKKYFETCGYIGTPKMAYMKAVYKNADFLLSADKPYSKIDYTQYNFVKKPVRIAFVDTSIYGIPFQGFDSYVGGKGGMKGVIAKAFTLFNEMGSEMDIACLVTVLSECLIVPSIALQDYIVWENIDDTHAKATISYYGISASGTFTFAENGEMISFTTNDRWAVETNGTKTQTLWSILISDYEEKDGIIQPTSFKTVWHYKNGDSVYFDSKNPTIEYH
jgi:hypothetical protein